MTSDYYVYPETSCVTTLQILTVSFKTTHGCFHNLNGEMFREMEKYV